MKDYACIAAVILAFVLGAGLTSAHYDREIALMEAAQATALKEAHEKNEKGLSDATNTILLAQDEYNSLRAERDRLLARLRHADSGRSGGGDSIEALRARVAELESLVGRMAETASRCGDGFERCAQKHDALADVVG